MEKSNYTAAAVYSYSSPLSINIETTARRGRITPSRPGVAFLRTQHRAQRTKRVALSFLSNSLLGGRGDNPPENLTYGWELYIQDRKDPPPRKNEWKGRFTLAVYPPGIRRTYHRRAGGPGTRNCISCKCSVRRTSFPSDRFAGRGTPSSSPCAFPSGC